MNRIAVTAVLLTSLGLAGAGGVPMAQTEGWKATYVKKRETVEFPTDLAKAKLKDDDWLTIGYTEYAGFKPRVGVVFSEEKINPQEPIKSDAMRALVKLFGEEKGETTNPFNHIEPMVRQALGKTGRFTMVERTTSMADVLGEQDFGASGRVDKKTAAKIGQMWGVDYIAKATIMEFNPEKDASEIKAIGGAAGGAAIGLGSFGTSGKVGFVRVNLVITDAETGAIVGDVTCDGTAKEKSAGFGAGMIGAVSGGLVGGGLGMKSKKGVIISDALQCAANKLAYGSSMKFDDVDWQTSVVTVSGSRVIIMGGTNVGLREGLSLSLWSRGEPLVNPEDPADTLEWGKERIGVLKVGSVSTKTSTCEITEGGQGAKRGDYAILPGRKRRL